MGALAVPHQIAPRSGRVTDIRGTMKSLFDATDRAEVLDRISGVGPDTPRVWGRMSPEGMLVHLRDSFDACLGERRVPDRSTFKNRTIIRFLATSTPMPWPQGVPTMPEVDQEIDGTRPETVEVELERLKAAADRFVRTLDPRTARHPIFGRMTRAQWGRWAYRHLDHHTRQFGL